MFIKPCTKCGIQKEYEDMVKSSRNKKGVAAICLECNREKGLKYYHETKEDNRETNNAKARDYRNNNLKVCQERSHQWKKDNPDKHYKHCLTWKSKNEGKVTSYKAGRKKAVKQATPYWVNKNKLQEIYILAALLTEQTGIKHEVDHIHPIKHKDICGLHIPENLQVLTAKENHVKRNKFKSYIESELK